MSNIYLKLTIEKNRRFQTFVFLSLKEFVTRSVFGSSFWEQNCVWLLYYFNFERNYDVLESKSLCILLNKNVNINKNETESKIENPTHSFRETNLVLQLI